MGKYADFVVFDPESNYKVEEKDIKSRFAEVSIYNRRELKGKVLNTFLRGEMIFDHSKEELVKTKTEGRVLMRKEFNL